MARTHLLVPRAWLLLPFLAACEATQPQGAPAPLEAAGIVRVSGDGQRAEVATALPELLVVKVTDGNGNAVPGASVAWAVDGGTLVAPSASTDSRGMAQAAWTLDTIAGPKHATATAAGTSVTFQATARAGPPLAVRVLPEDSAVYVGNAYPLRIDARDRWGNTAEELTFAAGGEVVVDGAGRVTGVSHGRTSIVVSAAGLADTAWVTVPPRGVAALVLLGHTREAPGGLVLMNLDLSDYRVAVPQWGVTASVFGDPRWMPDGKSVRVYSGGLSGWFLLVPGETSVSKGRIGEWLGYHPAFSADGRFVYAAQWPVAGQSGIARYAVADGIMSDSRPDYLVGPNPVQVVPRSAVAPTQLALSRDGQRLAYLRGSDLFVFTLATSLERALPIQGTRPAWSPTGEWISVLSPAGAIQLVSPDGERTRTLAGRGPHHSYSWSPDGKWIIAGRSLASLGAGSVDLIEVAGGKSFQLLDCTPARCLRQPAWRP